MKNTFYALLSVILYILFFPTTVNAQTVLFEDNFNDGDAFGWTVPRNTCSTNWQMNGFTYGIIIVNGCITESIPAILNITPGVSYSFEVDMQMPSSTFIDRNFVFKYKNDANWYGIHTYGNGVHIQKVVDGHVYPSWDSSYSFNANWSYHFKIEVYPSRIRLYINDSLRSDVNDPVPTFPNSSAGLQASGVGQVWFDNVVVTQIPPLETPTPSPSPSPSPTPPPSPTPTPTLTASPTPMPSPTPAATFGSFELPFNYSGRSGGNPTQFKNGFWQRLTAAFDHIFKVGVFKPFTGDSYTSCISPLSCYDSHNGTDFSTLGGQEVLSVANGIVSYTSAHTASSCTPEKGGFGCVAIVQYPGSVYGLYAHLDRIYINAGDFITTSTQIGEMGQTGCPGCGEHLHFGVLKPEGAFSLALSKLMTKKNWQDLLLQIKPDPGRKYKPACTYKAPNGLAFNFQDPSGWRGGGSDPWSLPKSQGGCGVNSPYLWKYDIGSTP